MHPVWFIKLIFYSLRTSLYSFKLALQVIYLIPKIIVFTNVCHKQNIRNIHSHFSGLAALSGQFIAKILNCNFSFTFHTLPELKNSIIKWNIRDASSILVNSKTNMAAVLSQFPELSKEKVHLVRSGLGLHIEEIKPLKKREYEFDVISVARLIPKKGIDILIESLLFLKRNGIEPSCGIIGDGPEKTVLEKLITKYSLRNVSLCGSLNNSEVIKKMRKSKIFVLPCRHAGKEEDGLPVAILEALASGVPVISCDVGGISEVVIENETGFLVPENDPLAVSKKILCLLTDSAILDKISAKSIQFMKFHFNKNDIIQKLKDIFNIEIKKKFSTL